MEDITGYLILAAIALIASTIMTLTHRMEKRGYGHGCATCPDRSLCHQVRKKDERG